MAWASAQPLVQRSRVELTGATNETNLIARQFRLDHTLQPSSEQYRTVRIAPPIAQPATYSSSSDRPEITSSLSERLASVSNRADPNWRRLRETVVPVTAGLKFDRKSYGFESFSSNTLAGVERSVRYFDASERKECSCVISGGKIQVSGEPFNPQKNLATSSKTWFREQDRFAYVLARTSVGEKPQLFIFKHIEGEVHHTSPVAGGNVLDAGFMSIRNGNVAYLENRSGHYKPAIECKLHTLAALKDGGADLSKIFVSERVEQWDMFGNSLVADEEAIDLAFTNKHPLYSAAQVFEQRCFSDQHRVVSSDGEYDLSVKTRITWR